jgi:hypothetical protein
MNLLDFEQENVLPDDQYEKIISNNIEIKLKLEAMAPQERKKFV